MKVIQDHQQILEDASSLGRAFTAGYEEGYARGENNNVNIESIVEKMFEIGGEPDMPCNRIQFMGGYLPNNVPLGGFSKGALIEILQRKMGEL